MDKKPTITTSCSHTSLQIFHGARKEGMKSIGIAVGERPRVYEAFPLARPDDFFLIGDYKDLLKQEVAEALEDKGCVIIPHGSFVEYMGSKNFKKIRIPVYGNKAVLDWESDRKKEREWLEGAGLKMPRDIKSLSDIDGPVIVKYGGAKGGKGFFIAKSREEVENRLNGKREYIMQEFIPGTRFYFHYFYSPIRRDGYRVAEGSLQLLSIDRRVESNIDEIYRLGSISELQERGESPGFTVTGNINLVLRESLLGRVLDMGARTIEESLRLFGGLWGPFCLETVIDKDLNIYVFEISARIVAGTNIAVPESPYSAYIEPGLTTGRRIAQELKYAYKNRVLDRILS